MNAIAQRVLRLAEPVAAQQGLEIWDVEYVKEAGTWFLRITIDRADDAGVSIDDCEAFSRAMDPILDEADPIEGSYTFEVGSAGIERALRRPSDFARFLGSAVTVQLYRPLDGSKQYVGKLTAYDDATGDIDISLDNANIKRFSKEQVALVRLKATF